MNLFVFAASHRAESTNRKLAKIAASMAQKLGAAIDLAEYGTFDMPIYDNETYANKPLPIPAQKFISHLKTAQGIIISSPEYNWSFPGSLKNIIDWVSVATPNPFAGKTALLLSASPSLRGGAQGLIQLKVPLEALSTFVFPRIFTLSRAEELFEKDDTLRDAKLHDELERIVRDFVGVTQAIASA